MPTKASSPTKNKGKVFFVAKSSGPLLGRLPLKLPYTKLVRENVTSNTIAYETVPHAIGEPKEKIQFLLSAAIFFWCLCEVCAVGSGYVRVTITYFAEKSKFHKMSPLNAFPLKFRV